MLIVFDIDGTLADCNHRLRHIRNKPKNWKKFFDEMANDTPIKPMVDACRTLWLDELQTHTTLIVTGRPDSYRHQTGTWLADHNIGWNDLYMRKAKDHRPDYVVKEEILGEIVEKYGRKPDLVFEDRPQVIEMWRRNGIFTVDVNQTGEDF